MDQGLAAKGVASDIEVLPIQQINEAYARMLNARVGWQGRIQGERRQRVVDAGVEELDNLCVVQTLAALLGLVGRQPDRRPSPQPSPEH